jgi:hypothetical protein
MSGSKPGIVEWTIMITWTMTHPWKDKLEKDSSPTILALEGKPLLKRGGGDVTALPGLSRVLLCLYSH